MYLVLAFQQYLGTFRARASSARWAAILSAMVGVLLLAGIFAVRDVAQFLFFLAMMNTFLCASRCNQLWYVSLDRYRAAGGVWPGRLRFRISEIVMLIALTVVVLGIVSY
ncbi:hypothetical protein C5Y93_14785 [Blastopirellula marina]|uniref:Uncharacterized protein n=2 Tax=Blastopirellula marina TaxID=124 RepID=A0A2S8GLB6_9BACT|nr:hypothetical protein C5Y93_14785 [Blastopirellula marina]